MFRDDAQTHAAIRLLLGTIPGLARMWTETGPTDEAAHVVEGTSSAMSSGEVLLVRVAFDLYNGQGGASFGRVLNTLGNEPLNALGALLVAFTQSPEAIEVWIAAQRARTRDSKPRPIEGTARH